MFFDTAGLIMGNRQCYGKKLYQEATFKELLIRHNEAWSQNFIF